MLVIIVGYLFMLVTTNYRGHCHSCFRTACDKDRYGQYPVLFRCVVDPRSLFTTELATQAIYSVPLGKEAAVLLHFGRYLQQLILSFLPLLSHALSC